MLISAIKDNPKSLNKFRKAVLIAGVDNIEISRQPLLSPGTCVQKRMGKFETFNCKNLIATLDNKTIFLYGRSLKTVDDVLDLIDFYLK